MGAHAMPGQVSSGPRIWLNRRECQEYQVVGLAWWANELLLPRWIHDWANQRGWWSPLVRTVQNKRLPWSISQTLSKKDSDSANGIREGCIERVHISAGLGGGVGGGKISETEM